MLGALGAPSPMESHRHVVLTNTCFSLRVIPVLIRSVLMELEVDHSGDMCQKRSSVPLRLQEDLYMKDNWQLPHLDVQAYSELARLNQMCTMIGIEDLQSCACE